MGEVYKATDTRLARSVPIKVWPTVRVYAADPSGANSTVSIAVDQALSAVGL